MEFEYNSRYHAMLSESINQANQVEFIIDDILAGEHFSENNKDVTKAAYLEYIENQLQGKQLSGKCKRLIDMPRVQAKLESNRMKEDPTRDLFKKWRRLRNVFTHGLIVYNSSSIPVLYHKGYCYDIESHVELFFQYNAQVISFLDMLDELKTKYRGTPVFADINCDPNHPIYASSDF